MKHTKYTDMKINIRAEKPGDYLAVKKVHDQAFGQPNEGLLVEKLRLNPDFIPALSLVAEMDGSIIGHILFFPIKVKGPAASYDALALAPMAVLPDLQKKGMGGQLITKGLETAQALGFRSVIVVGHPEYYPRFGFVPASRWGIQAPFDLPDEVFMAKELVADGLKEVSGMVAYPGEFEEVE
jgi:putative acetyltransferase